MADDLSSIKSGPNDNSRWYEEGTTPECVNVIYTAVTNTSGSLKL